MSPLDAGSRWALIVGHPGHELRLHGWLERMRPVVHVLTDGSGRGSASRLPGTSRLLAAAGGRAGAVYGAFTDRGFYETLLAGRHERVIAVVDALADALAADRIDGVVADACDGYNPAHDVCALVAEAAAALAPAVPDASPRSGTPPSRFDFPLVGPPAAESPPGSLRIRLCDAELARKLDAARRYSDLGAEVRDALERIGPEAFRLEVLRPAGSANARATVPWYESHGERQVRAGHYATVLRRSEHVAPLAEALAKHVALRCGTPT